MGCYGRNLCFSDSIDGGVILTSGTGLYAGGTFGFANSGSTVPAVSPFANPCTMIYNLRSATATQPNTHGAGMVGQIRETWQIIIQHCGVREQVY